VGCFPPCGVSPRGVWGLPPSGSFVARGCYLSVMSAVFSAVPASGRPPGQQQRPCCEGLYIPLIVRTFDARDFFFFFFNYRLYRTTPVFLQSRARSCSKALERHSVAEPTRGTRREEAAREARSNAFTFTLVFHWSLVLLTLYFIFYKLDLVSDLATRGWEVGGWERWVGGSREWGVGGKSMRLPYPTPRPVSPVDKP